MNNFLLIETSFRGAAVGLAQSGNSEIGQLKTYKALSEVGGSAEGIFNLVRSVLVESQTSIGGLFGVYTSVGPGSFTGIKIGISLAQGLIRGTDRNLKSGGVSTLGAYLNGSLVQNKAVVLPCTRTHGFLGYWNDGNLVETCFHLGSPMKFDSAFANGLGLIGYDLLAPWPEFLQCNPISELPLLEQVSIEGVQKRTLVGMARSIVTGQIRAPLAPNYLRLSTAEEAKSRSVRPSANKGSEVEII